MKRSLVATLVAATLTPLALAAAAAAAPTYVGPWEKDPTGDFHRYYEGAKAPRATIDITRSKVFLDAEHDGRYGVAAVAQIKDARESQFSHRGNGYFQDVKVTVTNAAGATKDFGVVQGNPVENRRTGKDCRGGEGGFDAVTDQVSIWVPNACLGKSFGTAVAIQVETALVGSEGEVLAIDQGAFAER